MKPNALREMLMCSSSELAIKKTKRRIASLACYLLFLLSFVNDYTAIASRLLVTSNQINPGLACDSLALTA